MVRLSNRVLLSCKKEDNPDLCHHGMNVLRKLSPTQKKADLMTSFREKCKVGKCGQKRPEQKWRVTVAGAESVPGE